MIKLVALPLIALVRLSAVASRILRWYGGPRLMGRTVPPLLTEAAGHSGKHGARQRSQRPATSTREARRPSVPRRVKLRLVAEAAGFCQNPSCLRSLFPDEGEPDSSGYIFEIAHIEAASDRGPRANKGVTSERRQSYSNLLVLCPTCHTVIDKAPETYTTHQLMEWKRNHVAAIRKTFGIDCYESRSDARKAILPLMEQNQFISSQYGPDNEYRLDPESEQAPLWKRKVRSAILPNNRKILLILDANTDKLSADERHMLEDFRQHVEEMEERHLGERSTVGRRFPIGMRDILSGGK